MSIAKEKARMKEDFENIMADSREGMAWW